MKRCLLLMLALTACFNVFAVKCYLFSSDNFDADDSLSSDVSTDADILYIDGEGGDLYPFCFKDGNNSYKFAEYIQYLNNQGNHITTIYISNVKDIIDQTFGDSENATNDIAEIHLAKINGTIKTGAFDHLANVQNVYLDQDGIVACEKGAFDQRITVGGTDTSMPTATLHITESNAKTYLEYYSFNLVDGQSNRDYVLNNGNGWQNFIFNYEATHRSFMVTKLNAYLGTYSSPFAALIPIAIENIYIVKPVKNVPKVVSLKAAWKIGGRSVYNYEAEGKPNLISSANASASLDIVEYDNKKYYYLPANTGVLIYSGNEFNILNIRDLSNIKSITYYDPSKAKFDETNLKGNLLTPLYNVEEVGPSDYDSQGKISYRNFFLSKASQTINVQKWLKDENPFNGLEVLSAWDRFFKQRMNWTTFWGYIFSGVTTYDYWAFFRSAKTNTNHLSKAYLHVPVEYCSTNMPRYLFNDEDKIPAVILNILGNDPKAKGFPFMYGLDLDENSITDEYVDEVIASLSAAAQTTGINEIQSNQQTDNDEYYYTLNGMKTTNPTKGIYIHKGRKVIVK